MDMSSFLLFVVFAFTVFVIVLIVLCHKYNTKKAESLGSTFVASKHNSFKDSADIGIFLHERAKVAGISFNGYERDKRKITKTEAEDFFRGTSIQLIILNRIAHRLGCEVVIRQKDKENTNI